MKKYILFFTTIVVAISFWKCNDFPIDEDGLLITERAQCYVSNFDLLGSDYQTVRTKAPVIDTTSLTIDIEVFYGTDLVNLYPRFTLVTDAKLDPKITGWTDFSGSNNPRKWTVISGNRKIKKTYTVTVTVQSIP